MNPTNPPNTTNAPTLYDMYVKCCQLLTDVSDFINFSHRRDALLGFQTRERPAPNAVRNERSAGKRPRDDSDDVEQGSQGSNSQGSQGSQSKQQKLTHNAEAFAARRQAMYDHPDMAWNQGGSHDIFFSEDQVPDELKVMMNLMQAFDVYMTCQDKVVQVRAILTMGMRRPSEQFDRFQMYLMGRRENLTHWYSKNEIEQLNLSNMNSLLKTGQIQPWMQCAHQAPAATSSGSGGGAASSVIDAASSVIGAASAAPLAAQGPSLAASPPDVAARVQALMQRLAEGRALQRNA